MLDVDSYNVAYVSCAHPSGALCGQADIIGEVSPKQAAAIRRAVANYRAKRSSSR